MPNVLKLNTGANMPQIGFGTWKLTEGTEAKSAVAEALKTGYRLIDTAKLYANEKSIGEAIKESDISRSELFITTKLWDSDQGYQSTLAAFDESLQKLGLEYVDLYLIHSPGEGRDKTLQSWKALEKLHREGRAKAIGVSNFNQKQIDDLVNNSNTMPAVNQIELHPFIYKETLPIAEFCKKHGIIVEAYTPLARGKFESMPIISKIAKDHGKTNSQVLLRWSIQHGYVPIPKSANPGRIKENIDIFDFELSKEDVQNIDALSSGEFLVYNPTS